MIMNNNPYQVALAAILPRQATNIARHTLASGETVWVRKAGKSIPQWRYTLIGYFAAIFHLNALKPVPNPGGRAVIGTVLVLVLVITGAVTWMVIRSRSSETHKTPPSLQAVLDLSNLGGNLTPAPIDSKGSALLASDKLRVMRIVSDGRESMIAADISSTSGLPVWQTPIPDELVSTTLDCRPTQDVLDCGDFLRIDLTTGVNQAAKSGMTSAAAPSADPSETPSGPSQGTTPGADAPTETDTTPGTSTTPEADTTPEASTPAAPALSSPSALRRVSNEVTEPVVLPMRSQASVSMLSLFGRFIDVVPPRRPLRACGWPAPDRAGRRRHDRRPR